MPLNVPDNLPAIEILKNENIFVMPESKAMHQDIRPLKIIILNLMPVKVTTEIHLLRMLSNTPLQAEVSLMNIKCHKSKNTPQEHLEEFYMTFDKIRDQKFDGLIITGAPVEHLDFEEVDYWDEMKEIMNWADHHVTSTLYICWAAQAGLYYHYGVPKYPEDKKIFGVFKHWINEPNEHIVRGFDDEFWVPHSRHTNLQRADLEKIPDLKIIAESAEAGVHIISSQNGKRIFVTGHSEYDPLTLKMEYDRDKSRGLAIDLPKNYFPADDPSKSPVVRWKSHASLFYSNWLNYYVYQATPFSLEEIS